MNLAFPGLGKVHVIAAYQSKLYDLAQFFIQNGLTLDHQSEEDKTALHY